MQRSIVWRRIVRIATIVGKPENGGVHSRRLVLHHILRLTFSDNWKTVRSALTIASTIDKKRRGSCEIWPSDHQEQRFPG